MPVLILPVVKLYLLSQITSVFACQGIQNQLNLNIYFFFLEVALCFFLCIRDTFRSNATRSQCCSVYKGMISLTFVHESLLRNISVGFKRAFYLKIECFLVK